MQSFSPLFVSGIARSGTTLLAHMLNSHPMLAVASDVLLPLFVSLRNASISESAQLETWDPCSPIQDYYFTDDRLRALDCVQHTPADIQIGADEVQTIREAMIRRARYEAADIVPRLKNIGSNTYTSMIESVLCSIAESRSKSSLRWVGAKDVWTIEFVRPLIRMFPDARFIVIMRDLRAIVASMLRMSEKDPTQAAQVMSYSRHWRKYIAFIQNFRLAPEIQERLHVLWYERLVSDPESEVRRLCDFLDVPFDNILLRTEAYCAADGDRWTGNSSFVDSIDGFGNNLPAIADVVLEPRIESMIAFVCGDEMRRIGIKCDSSTCDASELIGSFEARFNENVSWRSDLGNIQQDFGYELFRRALLQVRTPVTDMQLIRRSFLFEEVYDWLRTSSN